MSRRRVIKLQLTVADTSRLDFDTILIPTPYPKHKIENIIIRHVEKKLDAHILKEPSVMQGIVQVNIDTASIASDRPLVLDFQAEIAPLDFVYDSAEVMEIARDSRKILQILADFETMRLKDAGLNYPGIPPIHPTVKIEPSLIRAMIAEEMELFAQDIALTSSGFVSPRMRRWRAADRHLDVIREVISISTPSELEIANIFENALADQYYETLSQLDE